MPKSPAGISNIPRDFCKSPGICGFSAPLRFTRTDVFSSKSACSFIPFYSRRIRPSVFFGLFENSCLSSTNLSNKIDLLFCIGPFRCQLIMPTRTKQRVPSNRVVCRFLIRSVILFICSRRVLFAMRFRYVSTFPSKTSCLKTRRRVHRSLPRGCRGRCVPGALLHCKHDMCFFSWSPLGVCAGVFQQF